LNACHLNTLLASLALRFHFVEELSHGSLD